MLEAEKSAGDHIQELWQLVKDYAQQETIDPLKTLGRFVGFGVGATVIGGIGVTLLVLGLLRVLQEETKPHLEGTLSWVPYLITLIISSILVFLAYKAINKKSSKGAN